MSFEFHTTLISLEEMNNFINIIKKKFSNLKTLEECSIGEITMVFIPKNEYKNNNHNIGKILNYIHNNKNTFKKFQIREIISPLHPNLFYHTIKLKRIL